MPEPLLGYSLTREHKVAHSWSNGHQDKQVLLFFHLLAGPMLSRYYLMSAAGVRNACLSYLITNEPGKAAKLLAS